MSAATWLPSVLRTAGLEVKTYPGWRTRGRPGDFDPFAVLWHHTGSRTSMARPAPSVAFCITGSTALTGPLCQVVVGFDGVMHVIAAGRANHAGTNDGVGTGPVPAGSGNAQFIGFEFDYSGSQDMGPLQYDAGLKASAACLKHLKRDHEYARGHKETSTAGKWDPGRHGSSSPEYLMGGIRADIARQLVPPKVRYLLIDGEGDTLAKSEPVSSLPKPRVARLKSFTAAQAEAIDAELERDAAEGKPRDVRIVRVDI